MDASLVDISHRISKETPGAQPKLATKSVSFPDPPKAKSKKETAAESKATKEEVKEAKKAAAVDDQVELRRKVKAYLSNPKFQSLFQSIQEPGPKATDADWRTCYEQIAEVLKSTYKEMLVRTMFEGGCQAAETVMVTLLQMEQMTGLKDHMVSHRDKFEPELTEIAIELSNNWVPGPIPRLMFKMFNELKEFGKERGGVGGKAEVKRE